VLCAATPSRAAAPDGGSLFIDIVAPATILLQGVIDEGATQRLREEIAARDLRAATVVLDSPGGLLGEGMALGRLIRSRGYTTAVARGGACHSACVFALLGGVYRFAGTQSRIGVHRFSSTSPGVDADAAQIVSAAVVNYIREMGADVALFDRMVRMGSEQVLVLSAKELRELRVINDGRLEPHWELRARGSAMVLQGVQETADGRLQVVLSCQDDRVLFQPALPAGERADEIVGSARHHLMRLGAGFVPLPEPLDPLTASDGTVSATFALGPGQLKRLAGSDSVGYTVQSERGSAGFAVDTAGGAESLRNFVASCGAR
jgi:ATP-dependent protease ClpP protease subunit